MVDVTNHNSALLRSSLGLSVLRLHINRDSNVTELTPKQDTYTYLL